MQHVRGLACSAVENANMLVELMHAWRSGLATCTMALQERPLCLLVAIWHLSLAIQCRRSATEDRQRLTTLPLSFLKLSVYCWCSKNSPKQGQTLQAQLDTGQGAKGSKAGLRGRPPSGGRRTVSRAALAAALAEQLCCTGCSAE